MGVVLGPVRALSLHSGERPGRPDFVRLGPCLQGGRMELHHTILPLHPAQQPAPYVPRELSWLEALPVFALIRPGSIFHKHTLLVSGLHNRRLFAIQECRGLAYIRLDVVCQFTDSQSTVPIRIGVTSHSFHQEVAE